MNITIDITYYGTIDEIELHAELGEAFHNKYLVFYYNISTCPVPEWEICVPQDMKYTKLLDLTTLSEEEFFQYSLVHELELPIHLVLQIQKYVHENYQDYNGYDSGFKCSFDY